MLITSLNFIIFFVIILIIHYLIPGKLQNGWLLLASYIFIGFWSWQYALVLLCVTIFQFFYGLWLVKNKHKSWLVLGITVNIVVLLFFRSTNFFVREFMTLLTNLGIKSDTGAIEFLIPIGLSFYVLQNISYLVDVHRKQISPASNFINLALYLAYFPKLLAGPLERARTFLPKLEIDLIVDEKNIAQNIVLILGGMIRKLVIADALSATIPPQIFENPSNYSAYDLIGWLIVYAFVIYNDFAGYSSVARGVSGLLGIDLSKNFDFPYFARNFSEFWNRWHITLSHWLRDYIFFPLSRSLLRIIPNRHNIFNLFLPPMATMLVSGFWHGLSWHMILWGALHGMYLFIERLLLARKPIVPPDQQPRWRQMVSNGIVFSLVVLAWVPFRMEIPIAIQYWKGMLNLTDISLDSKILLIVLLYLGAWTILEWILYRQQERFFVYKLPQWAQAGIMAAAILLILVASASGTETPFIYQGF
jgi:D-alanyl-lipoteichoic acid acyltransferase DltB (MBOAT superfamily)